MKFSEKIQLLRKNSGMSQEDLAERLGVSRQSVSKWELGQSYPETEKILEMCQMFGVTVDSLLVDEEKMVQSKEKAAPVPSKRKNTIVPYIAILVLLILLISAVARIAILSKNADAALEEPDLEQNIPTTPNGFDQLKEYYYDFAVKYRLDYAPFFEKGKMPKDSTEYLFFAFAVNLDNWGEEKGKMTKQYVEETALSYFGAAGLNHLALRKAWDFDGKTYTAYPGSLKEEPIYVLREYHTWKDKGVQYYRVIMDCYASETILDPSEAKKKVMEGRLSELNLIQTEEICYKTNMQNFGAPCFIWHTIKGSMEDPMESGA